MDPNSDTDKTGTTHGATEGDPPAAESLTGAGDDRHSGDANDKTDWKAEYLKAKGKVERVNDLEAENAQLRARVQPPPAADPGVSEADLDRQVLEKFAATDPLARAVLRQRKETEQLVANLGYAEQLRGMPLEERQEVYQHFEKNRHRLGDPTAARAEVREKKLERELQATREELKRLSAAGSKRDPDVVRTEQREVGAAEIRVRKMTGAEWDAEQLALKHAGQNREAMNRQLAYERGEIDVTD